LYVWSISYWNALLELRDITSRGVVMGESKDLAKGGFAASAARQRERQAARRREAAEEKRTVELGVQSVVKNTAATEPSGEGAPPRVRAEKVLLRRSTADDPTPGSANAQVRQDR
jgi:hypothetical protein